MSSVAEYIYGDISREEYIESVRSEQMKSRIEPGSDLISRAEAIKALTKCAGVGKRALSVIEELPGVTEKGKNHDEGRSNVLVK